MVFFNVWYFMVRGWLNSLAFVFFNYICIAISFELTRYTLDIIIICVSLPRVWFNKLFSKKAKIYIVYQIMIRFWVSLLDAYKILFVEKKNSSQKCTILIVL